MAMMIRHDYSAIHEALNKMIIAEVKAWLKEMPEGAWYIMEGYMASCGYTAEERMKQALKKEVTV